MTNTNELRIAKLEKSVRLVLALDAHPESNVPGFFVRLDPKAKEQLKDALAEHPRQNTGLSPEDEAALPDCTWPGCPNKATCVVFGDVKLCYGHYEESGRRNAAQSGL